MNLDDKETLMMNVCRGISFVFAIAALVVFGVLVGVML